MNGLARLAMGLAILVAAPHAALAEPLDVTFENVSGQTVAALFVTPKDASPPSTVNVLTAAIGHEQKGAVSFEPAPEACVYSLAFTFADGSTQTRDDLDLCESAYIIIE